MSNLARTLEPDASDRSFGRVIIITSWSHSFTKDIDTLEFERYSIICFHVHDWGL